MRKNDSKRTGFLTRLLSLAVIMAMLMCIVGCVAEPGHTNGSVNLGTNAPPTSNNTQPTVTQPPATQPPQTDPDALIYTLTQENVDEFYRLLTESEELAIAGEDMDAIETLVDALDESYEFLNAQCSIATILHYSHTKNADLENQYLDCVDICTKANDAYLQMARRVYQSDTPAKDMLFEGWTEQDIADLMAYDEQISVLQQRNAEIGVEYRTTKDDATKITLYIEFVQNNNRIAAFYDYDNYYTYAYERVYERDYDMDAVAQMRQYVKTYLVKSYDKALMNFSNSFYSELTYNDQVAVQDFLYENYDYLSVDYIEMYLNAVPQSLADNMRYMLEHDSLFTEAGDAMPGAFTTSIGQRSYCYFGPGYASSNTVVHEGGHYYASRFCDISSVPLDLAETHSQGNEWLFVSFLEGVMPEKQHKALVDYLLYENIAMSLICMMVDEFEERVYTTDLTDFTAADFDAIMDTVTKGYFPFDDVSNKLADMHSYWRQVVVEQPVYYISYAVSGIAALSMYTAAQADFDAAFATYQKLCEEPVLEAGFLGNISEAGLASPFDEQFYRELKNMIYSH